MKDVLETISILSICASVPVLIVFGVLNFQATSRIKKEMPGIWQEHLVWRDRESKYRAGFRAMKYFRGIPMGERTFCERWQVRLWYALMLLVGLSLAGTLLSAVVR